MKEECVFCSIIDGREPAVVVYRNKEIIAFLDHYPLNPGHTLVVPRKHYRMLDEMPPGEVGVLFTNVAIVMRAVWKAVKADGINIGQSNGSAASQDVFHVHVHVIPRFGGDTHEGSTFPGRKDMGHMDREKFGRRIRQALEKTDIR